MNIEAAPRTSLLSRLHRFALLVEDSLLVAILTALVLLATSQILLALLGAPLFSIIAAGAMLGFHRSEIDLSVVAIEFYRIAEMPVLLAILSLPLPVICSAKAARRSGW